MVRDWVDFDIEHARYIVEKVGRSQERWADSNFVDHWYRTWKGRLRACTLLVDGKPMACLGFSMQEWNKAEAWALFAEGFEKHKLAIYRMVKAGLKLAMQQKVVRIQTTIDPSNKRWIESLGFEYEGLLRKYGPLNEDYLLYSMVN